MVGQHCKSCIYFKDTEHGSVGVCRRFPTKANVGREDWCGEFRTEMLALPVVETQRKPGRPKKEVQDVQAS